MKIGTFSNKYAVSQDTIRYYIKQKLLLPHKNGSQYDFTPNCETDIQIILELKTYQFSIIEIKKLLFYMRISKLEPKLKSLFIQSALRKKQDEIKEEIESLKSVETLLDDHLEDILSEPLEQHAMGVPLSFVEKMLCQKCHGSYKLNASSIVDNEVYEGSLVCTCDELIIEEGIINCTNNENSKTEILNFSEYVEHTDTEHFQMFYSVMDWIEYQMDFDALTDKVLLDLGSGFGIFIRLIYNQIPESTTIVCVDYNLESLNKLKELLSFQKVKKKVVFLCCDFKEIPMKDKSIDCLCDMAGRTNFYLHQYSQDIKVDEVLLEDLTHYMNDHSSYYGYHYIFKKFSTSHYIKPNHYYLFKREQLYKEMNLMGLTVVDEKITGKLPVGGRYESFYSEKDAVHTMGIIAKK